MNPSLGNFELMERPMPEPGEGEVLRCASSISA